jgi:histidine triad (HIT) family protein
MSNCIFCKIAAKEIQSEIVYEDDTCVAFRDAAPQAPVHVLVVPKNHTEHIADYSESDAQLIGHIHLVACRVAQDLGVGDGFRLVTNNGSTAGQSVFHWHVHILGGRRMNWPPG